MDSEETCCICLETANVKESLKLIDCGCNSSWFHTPCENQWISLLEEFEYYCPICRRPVPLKTNYSFSIYSGDDQRYLWFIISMISIEIGLTFNNRIVWMYPFQSVGIISLPFVFPSDKALPFFLNHVVLHNAVNSFFAILTYYEKDSQDLFFDFCRSIGGIHLFTLWCMSIFYHSYQIDPLIPYAISREVKHRNEIKGEHLTIKPPTRPFGPLPADKP